MKRIKAMSLGEVAAFVCDHLKKNGIEAVLSGGACVSIYTSARYKSFDLDFIERTATGIKRIRQTLAKIGFVEKDRYFVHPDSEFFIDFLPGPLAVGGQPVGEIQELTFPTGRLALLSPTDCVKDRLAAYYHWNDQESLAQALLVAEAKDVDLGEIARWSGEEGKSIEFQSIRAKLVRAARKSRRPSKRPG